MVTIYILTVRPSNNWDFLSIFEDSLSILMDISHSTVYTYTVCTYGIYLSYPSCILYSRIVFYLDTVVSLCFLMVYISIIWYFHSILSLYFYISSFQIFFRDFYCGSINWPQICMISIFQGWALHSFPFSTFRSFPFFKKNVLFFSILFSSFWQLIRPKRTFRSFLKNVKECNVLLQRM